MIRIHPDKVTPIRDEAASKADLAGRYSNALCGRTTAAGEALRMEGYR